MSSSAPLRIGGTLHRISVGVLFSSSVHPAETRGARFTSIVSLFSCLTFGVHYMAFFFVSKHTLCETSSVADRRGSSADARTLANLDEKPPCGDIGIAD